MKLTEAETIAMAGKGHGRAGTVEPAYAASVPDDEWEKLRPLILRLFLQLQNSGLD